MAEPGGNVLCFDLEMNTDGTKTEDIIQIGWAIGNISRKEVILTKSMHVRIDKPLYPFIIELTGISQVQINLGYPLEHVFKLMMQDFYYHDCHSMPVVWGMDDSSYLRAQLSKLGESDYQKRSVWPLGRRIQDVKTLYQGYCHINKISLRRGLKTACRQYGIGFEGKAHDAEADALNTLRLYFELIHKFKEK